MPPKLTRFLIELSQDPLKRQRFENDPETTMTAAGLSAADKELVLARDASRIRAHFGVKTLAHMTCIPSGPPTLDELVKCIRDLIKMVQNHEARIRALEKTTKLEYLKKKTAARKLSK